MMISGLLLMLMFKYYFTARIRQWRRHFFVSATLRFNLSFCYSPANQNTEETNEFMIRVTLKTLHMT